MKAGTLAAIGALVVAMPAAAHPGGNGHGGKSSSHSHKCQPHKRAYVEAGTVDSATASTLAQNSDGTWSGTLVVDVIRSNRAAKADRGQTVTYSFDSAPLRVRFAGGTSGFSAGERVRLLGKVQTVARRCTAPDPAPAPVFHRLVVHPAASTVTSGSSDS